MTKENTERLKLASDLKDHRAWNKLLLPWIDEQIEKNKDITKIKINDDVVLEVQKRLSKVAVYKNLKNLPDQIINELETKLEEEKHGRRDIE